MYTVKHNNIFFAFVATTFGHFGHHQANTTQRFKKVGYKWCIKMLSCMGSHLH